MESNLANHLDVQLFHGWKLLLNEETFQNFVQAERSTLQRTSQWSGFCFGLCQLLLCLRASQPNCSHHHETKAATDPVPTVNYCRAASPSRMRSDTVLSVQAWTCGMRIGSQQRWATSRANRRVTTKMQNHLRHDQSFRVCPGWILSSQTSCPLCLMFLVSWAPNRSYEIMALTCLITPKSVWFWLR